jgi:hypothetical protein
MNSWSSQEHRATIRLPPLLLDYDRTDVAAQRVRWQCTGKWQQVFAPFPEVATAVADEVETHGGIRRSFVHGYAAEDPVHLFAVTMAWGFGRNGRGASRVLKMTAQSGFAKNVSEIVRQTQTGGAAAGWSALFGGNRTKYLAVAFGTKLLYFAGYTSDCPGPRPLILDQYVRKTLVNLGAPIPPKGTVWRNDYLTYLLLAERWAQDIAWNESPELVEFALFARGKEIAKPTAPIPVEPDPTDDIPGGNATTT